MTALIIAIMAPMLTGMGAYLIWRETRK